MEPNIQSGAPFAQGIPPIIGEGWVQLGGPSSEKITFDKLSRAEQERIMSYMVAPQYPVLMPPQEFHADMHMSGIFSVKAGDIEAAKNKMIMAMLDHWIESIKKNAELSREEEQKRAILKVENIYDTYKKNVDGNADPHFNIFAVGLIISATGIQQALMPVVDGSAFNPVVNMCMQTAPVMGDMRAELGLIGAIYSVGLQYFTNALIAGKAAEGGKSSEPIDLAYAKKYGENVLQLMVSPHFNAYLNAIITSGAAKGEPLTKERVSELVAMLKLVFSASALAILYKAEAGKMTSLEFASMIKGEMPFEEGSLYHSLIISIRSSLGEISPKVKSLMLNSLFEYFDSDPSLENLSDPAKVFSSLYGQLPRGDISG